MTDPRIDQIPDPLDLDAEVVKDLEPEEHDAAEIRGGRLSQIPCGMSVENCTQG